jgi:Tfp pilus assembly protein PilF
MKPSIIILGLLLSLLGGCFTDEAPRPSVDKHQDSLELIDQGTVLLRQGQLDRAQAAFAVAFQLVPCAAALDGLGAVAYARGEFIEAEKLFKSAINLDQNYGVALSNLALLYENQGLRTLAGKLYMRAEILEPRNIRLRNNFAGFRTNQGDIAGARETLLEAAAISDNPIIEANVKRLQQQS